MSSVTNMLSCAIELHFCSISLGTYGISPWWTTNRTSHCNRWWFLHYIPYHITLLLLCYDYSFASSCSKAVCRHATFLSNVESSSRQSVPSSTIGCNYRNSSTHFLLATLQAVHLQIYLQPWESFPLQRGRSS
jgi:hypothetical protein